MKKSIVNFQAKPNEILMKKWRRKKFNKTWSTEIKKKKLIFMWYTYIWYIYIACFFSFLFIISFHNLFFVIYSYFNYDFVVLYGLNCVYNFKLIASIWIPYMYICIYIPFCLNFVIKSSLIICNKDWIFLN